MGPQQTDCGLGLISLQPAVVKKRGFWSVRLLNGTGHLEYR